MEAVANIFLARSPGVSRTIKVTIPILMIILLIGIGWSKFGPFKRSLPAVGSSQTGPNAAANITPEPKIDGVRSTLKSDGFDPASATCPAGHVQLAVENVSGSAPLTLRLTNANGEVVGEYQLEKYLLKQEVTLQPGTYALKEVNHSAWVLQITAQ